LTAGRPFLLRIALEIAFAGLPPRAGHRPGILVGQVRLLAAPIPLLPFL
jgi:hypothetical protein